MSMVSLRKGPKEVGDSLSEMNMERWSRGIDQRE
jgi:hypothetical protein